MQPDRQIEEDEGGPSSFFSQPAHFGLDDRSHDCEINVELP